MTTFNSNSNSSSAPRNLSVAPIAWNQKNPYVLEFVATSSSSQRSASCSNGGAVPVLQQVTPLPGITCADPELAALGTMIDAVEEFYQERGQRLIDGPLVCQQLSLQYRRAMRTCLQLASLTSQQTQVAMAMDIDANQQSSKTDETDFVNMELLRATETVLHISDVFLPLIPASNAIAPDGPESAWNQQGRVTADFVRYLRIQHYTRPEASPQFQEVTQARQPEGFGRQYWELVERYVVSGCLVQAWDLLQRHSIYQLALQQQQQHQHRLGRGMVGTMNSNQDFFAERAAETLAAFDLVRDVMMRAPLPGGRDGQLDEKVSLGYPEEVLDDVDMYSDEHPVRPSDYKLWEQQTSSAMGAMFSIQHQDIMDKYNAWHEYVKEARRTLAPGRVPELARILSILSGDFADYKFNHWCDGLLADLLYRKPDLRPRDLVRRARKYVRQYSPDAQRRLDPILSIMEGNAIKAIQLLRIYGGESGAALPVTMTALIYNLFLDAGILGPDDNIHSIDYLNEAAAAIVASIKDASVGVSLATRLLMPFAVNGGDRSIVGTISEIIGHYFPKSDADAKGLISQCRPLIERKSAAILDVCTDLLLARHRAHVDKLDFAAATRCLLDGIVLEELANRPGACGRTLASQCLQMSLALVRVSTDDTMTVSHDDYLSATQATVVLKEDSEILVKMYEAQLLCLSVSIYESCIQGHDGNGYPSQEIVDSLKLISDPKTCVRLALAGPQLSVWLLRTAQGILRSEASADGAAGSGSSFGKDGVALLSECLQGLEASSSLAPSSVGLSEMAKLLLIARGRAEVACNTLLKNRRSLSSWDSSDLHRIRSVDLEKHPQDVQEKVVRMMLDYY